ncbi:MFS transporter [Novosphingobium humi]|uniref:MFS transporter n=1 Tax=Novosphingobium humi TaxID=2282397 RepID=A0ABY7TXK4_9SPHN|nr:MFS transporter [Novosphingobium humi]WCT77998.1 MFS transporter [Novosphingobium humi]
MRRILLAEQDGWPLERVWAGLRGCGLPAAAVLGCLQPAIDPVFLTLLSRATPLRAVDHGWVVGMTQSASALAALMVWWLGPRMPQRAVVALALGAMAAGLLTPLAVGLGGLLALRGIYGLGMGAIYARAMGGFAAARPTGAYAIVLLVQLMLATLLSLALPDLAARVGAGLALGLLGLVPLAAALALGLAREGGGARLAPPGRSATPPAGWALALANFWFICATMMVWSLCGALAVQAGHSEGLIGRAVAIGSLAGAATAIAVMRERLRVPLPVTACLVGASLLAPLVLTRPGAGTGFVLAMVLLNIGSTAIIIRCSGLASALGLDPRFRVFVAATHNLGMSAGPALGSGLLWVMPDGGLLVGAGLAVLAGVAAVVIGWRGLRHCAHWPMPRPVFAAWGRQKGLD